MDQSKVINPFTGELAEDNSIEDLAGATTDAYIPFCAVTTDYPLVALEGYPVADLEVANDQMDQIASDLRDLLQIRPEGQWLPFIVDDRSRNASLYAQGTQKHLSHFGHDIRC